MLQICVPCARMHRTDFERKIRMQAIILCGGLATRLGNTTKTVPKILLEISGKTVLEWQIQLLRDVNVEEVILASGHLHQVKSTFPLKPSVISEMLWGSSNKKYTLWGTILVLKCLLTVCRSDFTQVSVHLLLMAVDMVIGALISENRTRNPCCGSMLNLSGARIS